LNLPAAKAGGFQSIPLSPGARGSFRARLKPVWNERHNVPRISLTARPLRFGSSSDVLRKADHGEKQARSPADERIMLRLYDDEFIPF